MKLVKSIFCPVRVTRDFSFISRRLRRGKSSFFGKRAAGGGSESHEPSSPKVTCIGQVRVKSKRKARQCRSLSRRRSRSGEVSFRKAEGECRRHQQQQQAAPQEHRNQRWVHLPVCEALRELSCVFPSRSCSCSCSCSREVSCWCWCCRHWSGCGAVLWKWLVCGTGKTEIEEEEEERGRRRNHVFEDIEVRDGRIHVKGEETTGVVGVGVTISVPPKNALLLMRCRSDPIKMAALANRITWAAPPNFEEEESDDGCCPEILEVIQQEPEQEEEEEEEEIVEDEKEEVESNMSSFEALLDNINQHETEEEEEEEEEDNKGSADKTHKGDDDVDMEIDQPVNESSVLPECLLLMMCEPKLSMEVSKETWVRGTDFIRWLPPRKPARPAKAACCHHHPDVNQKHPPPPPPPPPPPGVAIPDPKPPRPAGLLKKTDPQQQPARSSCSLLTEQQISNGGVEPLVLTRCKSEPMSTAADKLMPEPCSRKDPCLQVGEPHPVAVTGASGVS